MKYLLYIASAFLALSVSRAGAEEAAVDAIGDETVAAFFQSFAAACERDGGALWGVTLCGPFLVYDEADGVVYANAPDRGGVLQSRETYWRGEVSPDNAPPYTNTAAEWSGVRWATLRIEDIEDPDGAVRLALHESFHRIQPQLNQPSAAADLPSHLDTEQGRALLRAEMRALRAALETASAGKKKTARRHLRNASAFRSMRYRLFADAAAQERALEVNEGLAEYTGWRAAADDLNFAAIAARLQEKESEKSYIRSFAYWTGPAYGLLFDYLKADWRPRFSEAQTSFLSIAEAAAGAAGPSEDVAYESLPGAYPEYALKEVYAEEAAFAKEIAARKADYIARFVEGGRLVVPLNMVNFDPQTVMSLDDYGQVYGTLSTDGPWGAVSTKSGALVVWKEHKIYLDRRDVDGPPPWTTDVWTLSINDGWTLRDDGRDLIVEKK